MTERFGEQTLGFVAVTLGDPDPNGVRQRTRTQVNVQGCRFRPLRADERDGLATTATEVWKATAPPVAAVLAAESIDEVVYDGTDNPQRGSDDENVYQIVGGDMPFADMDGELFKVTVIVASEKG